VSTLGIFVSESSSSQNPVSYSLYFFQKLNGHVLLGSFLKVTQNTYKVI